LGDLIHVCGLGFWVPGCTNPWFPQRFR